MTGLIAAIASAGITTICWYLFWQHERDETIWWRESYRITREEKILLEVKLEEARKRAVLPSSKQSWEEFFTERARYLK